MVNTSVPTQRRTTVTGVGEVDDTAAAPRVRPTIRAVWNADCSATVELARLVGPSSGLWWLPVQLTHPLCVAQRCDLGLAEHKIALYERCLTVGTQYDIYSWLNLPDLLQLWHLLVLPAGLKAEWAGALRSAGLLPTPTLVATPPDLITSRPLATTGLRTQRQP